MVKKVEVCERKQKLIDQLCELKGHDAKARTYLEDLDIVRLEELVEKAKIKAEFNKNVEVLEFMDENIKDFKRLRNTLNKKRHGWLKRKVECLSYEEEEESLKDFIPSEEEIAEIKRLLNLQYPLVMAQEFIWSAAKKMNKAVNVILADIDHYNSAFEALLIEAIKPPEEKGNKKLSTMADDYIKENDDNMFPSFWLKLLGKRFVVNDTLRHLKRYLPKMRQHYPDALIVQSLLRHLENERGRLHRAREEGNPFRINRRLQRVEYIKGLLKDLFSVPD